MNIGEFRKKLSISEKQWKILVVLSLIWLLGCFLLFLPPIRSLIIAFGEMLIHRGLTHPVWHGRFTSWGISGIIAYILLFLVLLGSLYEECFLNKKNSKNLVKLLVLAITGFMVFLIMYHANWIFGDDHEYIATTAINTYVLPYLGGGRFYPLGHIHYNLPLLLFRLLGINTGLPVTFHYILIALFYIVTAGFLYPLFKSSEPFKEKQHLMLSMFFFFTFPLTASSFASVFMSLIFPETVLIMLLSVFMFCYYKALETDKNKYYIPALIVVLYGSYCKEPVFGIFLIIPLINLVFRYKEQTKREKIFNGLLILNAVVFITLYYFLSFKKATGFYNAGRVESSALQFIGSAFLNTKILILIFLLGFIRLFYIFFKADKSSLYYDSLLFGAMGYVLAYLVLRLNSGYYFLSAVVLSLPSFVYRVKYLFEKKIIYAIYLLFLISAICAINSAEAIDTVKGTIKARQEFMPYIQNLAEEYNDGKTFIWYESDNAVTDNTFYKAVRGWRQYVENAFLNYVNKTEKNHFIVSRKIENLDENTIFFYPKDNDQGQPMPDSLEKILKDNNFILYKDSYDVFIYKAAEKTD